MFNNYISKGILGLRRVPKGDIRKIAKCTGATVVTTLATPEGDEIFESSFLGQCKEVYEEAVGDNDFIFF
jgi:T-complex protein 1 subunit alpha